MTAISNGTSASRHTKGPRSHIVAALFAALAFPLVIGTVTSGGADNQATAATTKKCPQPADITPLLSKYNMDILKLTKFNSLLTASFTANEISTCSPKITQAITDSYLTQAGFTADEIARFHSMVIEAGGGLADTPASTTTTLVSVTASSGGMAGTTVSDGTGTTPVVTATPTTPTAGTPTTATLPFTGVNVPLELGGAMALVGVGMALKWTQLVLRERSLG